MVFQQYALFPHMSIYDNVAFGLKVKRVPRARAPRADRTRSCASSSSRASSAGGRAALRRPAAARRAGARARQPAGGAAPRRAARRARREAAQADAARAEADPARARHDVRLRDARPGRGARDVGPDRGHERRPGRADREPARDLRAPGDRVRRRLHRLAERARADGRRGRRRVRGHAARRGRAGRRRRSAPTRAPAMRSAWRCDPSACRSGRPEAAPPRAARGSRGRSPQIVYLGMYTQFHVDTQGRPRRLATASPTSSARRRSRPGLAGRALAGTPEHASAARRRRSDRRALA